MASYHVFILSPLLLRPSLWSSPRDRVNILSCKISILLSFCGQAGPELTWSSHLSLLNTGIVGMQHLTLHCPQLWQIRIPSQICFSDCWVIFLCPAYNAIAPLRPTPSLGVYCLWGFTDCSQDDNPRDLCLCLNSLRRSFCRPFMFCGCLHLRRTLNKSKPTLGR